MAISGVVYSGKEVQLGIAQESTFGTAIADNAAFVQIPEFDSISIDYGLTQDFSLKNRGKRIAYDADLYASQTGGTRVITISGMVVRRTELAEWLYGVFQNVTEGAATPYEKTFSVADDQPDFASNEGYFFTLGIKNPITAYDEKYTSCIVREITISADMVGGDGRLKADVTIISGFAASTTSTLSGTWTISTQNYYDANLFDTKTYNTNDLVLYGFSVSINNNAKRIGNNSSGNAEGYAIGVPEIEITGNLNVKYDANTQGALADTLAGTERVIEFGLADGTAAGDLMFDFNEAVLVSTDRDDNRDEGVSRTLNFKAVANSGATPQIRVADGVDQAW